MTTLALDKSRAKMLGVCAGIARSFDLDPLIVRLGFLVVTLAGFGLPVLAYIAMPLLVESA